MTALIKYDTTRVSVHHNLFINGVDRQPMCAASDVATANPTEIVCDARNNLIWAYRQNATNIRAYGTANVVNNYYYSPTLTSCPDCALTVNVGEGAVAYANGNYSQNGINIDGQGNRSTPFAAPAITQTEAITAAHQIVAKAGARGPSFSLDAIDLGYVLNIPPVQRSKDSVICVT